MCIVLKSVNYSRTGKNETEMAYKESVRSFEEIATKLYDLLKRKKI